MGLFRVIKREREISKISYKKKNRRKKIGEKKKKKKKKKSDKTSEGGESGGRNWEATEREKVPNFRGEGKLSFCYIYI